MLIQINNNKKYYYYLNNNLKVCLKCMDQNEKIIYLFKLLFIVLLFLNT